MNDKIKKAGLIISKLFKVAVYVMFALILWITFTIAYNMTSN